MFVRGMGVRDIAEVEQISIGKVLYSLVKLKAAPQAKQSHYDELEIDEFWGYVGKKSNKVWLIYAYHRSSGEIVAWVFGKRNYKTAKALRKKIQALGITYDLIAIDDWKSFKKAFRDDICRIGKEFTKGIEGNNCRLRHRIRRAFRRSCNFSKKLENHVIAFESSVERLHSFTSTLALFNLSYFPEHHQEYEVKSSNQYGLSTCILFCLHFILKSGLYFEWYSNYTFARLNLSFTMFPKLIPKNFVIYVCVGLRDELIFYDL